MHSYPVEQWTGPGRFGASNAPFVCRLSDLCVDLEVLSSSNSRACQAVDCCVPECAIACESPRYHCSFDSDSSFHSLTSGKRSHYSFCFANCSVSMHSNAQVAYMMNCRCSRHRVFQTATSTARHCLTAGIAHCCPGFAGSRSSRTVAHFDTLCLYRRGLRFRERRRNGPDQCQSIAGSLA